MGSYWRTRRCRPVDSWLESLGYYRSNNPFDEACLFRAVSGQIYLTEEHHEQVRKSCIEYGRRFSKQFTFLMNSKKQWFDHLAKLEAHSMVCGNIEMHLISRVYRKEVTVFDSVCRRVYNITDNKYSEFILICAMRRDHYDAVYKLNLIEPVGYCQDVHCVNNGEDEGMYEQLEYINNEVALGAGPASGNSRVGCRAVQGNNDVRPDDNYPREKKLEVGMCCLLTTRNTVMKCYVQQIYPDMCVVYIPSQAEKRNVKYADLTLECEPNIWNLSRRFSNNVNITPPTPQAPARLRRNNHRGRNRKRNVWRRDRESASLSSADTPDGSEPKANNDDRCAMPMQPEPAVNESATLENLAEALELDVENQSAVLESGYFPTVGDWALERPRSAHARLYSESARARSNQSAPLENAQECGYVNCGAACADDAGALEPDVEIESASLGSAWSCKYFPFAGDWPLKRARSAHASLYSESARARLPSESARERARLNQSVPLENARDYRYYPAFAASCWSAREDVAVGPEPDDENQSAVLESARARSRSESAQERAPLEDAQECGCASIFGGRANCGAARVDDADALEPDVKIQSASLESAWSSKYFPFAGDWPLKRARSAHARLYSESTWASSHAESAQERARLNQSVPLVNAQDYGYYPAFGASCWSVREDVAVALEPDDENQSAALESARARSRSESAQVRAPLEDAQEYAPIFGGRANRWSARVDVAGAPEPDVASQSAALESARARSRSESAQERSRSDQSAPIFGGRTNSWSARVNREPAVENQSAVLESAQEGSCLPAVGEWGLERSRSAQERARALFERAEEDADSPDEQESVHSDLADPIAEPPDSSASTVSLCCDSPEGNVSPDEHWLRYDPNSNLLAAVNAYHYDQGLVAVTSVGTVYAGTAPYYYIQSASTSPVQFTYTFYPENMYGPSATTNRHVYTHPAMPQYGPGYPMQYFDPYRYVYPVPPVYYPMPNNIQGYGYSTRFTPQNLPRMF